jgi:hypothetical protein
MARCDGVRPVPGGGLALRAASIDKGQGAHSWRAQCRTQAHPRAGRESGVFRASNYVALKKLNPSPGPFRTYKTKHQVVWHQGAFLCPSS